MFGVSGTPDTSGYGRLQVRKSPLFSSPRPYGGYFDTVADALAQALEADGLGFGDAGGRGGVEQGELPFFIRRERLAQVAEKFLHDPKLRFEVFSGVSGVHYPDEA